MIKGRLYLTYRRIVALYNSFAFIVCRLFPIDDLLVSVCSFEGRSGFGCNPKYVIMELHRVNPNYRIVWFVNDMSRSFPDYIQKVPNSVWSRAYWLGRSKIWIDNYRKPYGTVKRKGQLYINTWHGCLGFKPIGLMRGKNFSEMAYIVSSNDSKMIDLVTVDSIFSETLFPRGMVYEGHMLRTGCPRYDGLINDKEKKYNDFRIKHGLVKDAKVVMFAPTFREKTNNEKRSTYIEEWSIDFEKLLENLAARFGGKWYLCIRLHPQVSKEQAEKINVKIKDRVINESDNDDLYDILPAMDAFITDYSGAAFEAAMIGIPVFLYADDVHDYIKQRGDLIWDFIGSDRHDISVNKLYINNLDLKLPFPLANNNEELLYDINHFDETEYRDKTLRFRDQIQLKMDGCSSADVVKEIMQSTGL